MKPVIKIHDSSTDQVVVREMTDIEFQEWGKNTAERENFLSKTIRYERNLLLSACDWTHTLDAPVDRAAWAVYRQALRDVPQQAGFPTVIDWPVAPS